MSQKVLPHQDNGLREAWWGIHRTGECTGVLTVDNADKIGFLKTIYDGLYAELRDIHTRQQQAVAWGMTILTGGGFITLVLSGKPSPLGTVVFSMGLAALTFVITKTLNFLSEDRMSIARQVDRVHLLMGVFMKGYYVVDNTLFDPSWYGWGFEKSRDVNWRLSRLYQIVLWGIFAIDVIVLLNKAELIGIF